MRYKREIYNLKKRASVIASKVHLLRHASKEQREFASKVEEKAESNMDRRLEVMNNFKAQLEKQAGTFLTRVEMENIKSGYELATKQLIEKFENLANSNREKIVKIENTISNWQGRLYIIGLVYGGIILFLNWYLNHNK